MRGRLADAIRAGYVEDVEAILKAYMAEERPPYMQKIVDQKLDDAARLARNVEKRNQIIQDVIRKTQKVFVAKKQA